MTNRALLAESSCDKNVREAQQHAQKVMRAFDRDKRGYSAADLLVDLDMCRKKVDALRLIAKSDATEQELHGFGSTLQKLSMIEIAVARLAGIPYEDVLRNHATRLEHPAAHVAIRASKG